MTHETIFPIDENGLRIRPNVYIDEEDVDLEGTDIKYNGRVVGEITETYRGDDGHLHAIFELKDYAVVDETIMASRVEF